MKLLLYMTSKVRGNLPQYTIHDTANINDIKGEMQYASWYFCDISTGPTHPISCLPTTTPPHNLNFSQPFVIFIIFYIFTSLNQSYPCYCSETCTEPTNSIFFVFHVAPGLCHLDFSFSVCNISHKLNFV